MFYDLLKHGVLLDDNEELVLKIAETDPPFLRQPDTDLILSEDIRKELVLTDPLLAPAFRRIDKVELYSVDPHTPPPGLDRIVTRDDLHIVMWRKLTKSKRSLEQCMYRFEPPVFKRPLRLASSDLTEVTVQLPKVHHGKSYFRETEVGWSSGWRDQRSCCWVDGGYFLRDDLFEIVAKYLDSSDWSTFDL